MSEQEKEITQPVVVNSSTPAHSPDEGTQPVKVTPDAPQTQLPEWLLKFASSPEQTAEETLPDAMPDFQTPYFEEIEEEQAFTPPVTPGEYEWQELSDFQEQEPLELEPVAEAAEVNIDIVEETTVKVNETLPAIELPVDPAEAFRLEVRDLLKNGKRAEALAMIRENKTDPVLAKAARKTLRSQLTLSSEAGDLWEIYDELNSSSL